MLFPGIIKAMIVSGERFWRSARQSSVRKCPEPRVRIVSSIRVVDTFFLPGNRSSTSVRNVECTELSGKCTELSGKCTELSGKCTEIYGKCTELSGKCTELPVICSCRTPSRVWTVAFNSGSPGLRNVYHCPGRPGRLEESTSNKILQCL